MAFETYDASVDSSAIGTSGSMAAASARMRAIRLAGSAAVRTVYVSGRNEKKTYGT